eukprot:gene11641-15591_t
MSKRNRLLILYGSETGTAEEVAYSLCNDMLNSMSSNQTALLHSTIICSIDDYNPSLLCDEDFVVFVVSTCGDGEPPAKMKLFWQFLLKKSLPVDCLSSVRFTVFGLGDSSYEKYNSTGRKLYARMNQLGAASFVQLGLGDDQHKQGYLYGLNIWKSKLLKYFFGENLVSVAKSITKVEYNVTIISDYSNNDLNEQIVRWNTSFYNISALNWLVLSNNRLTESNWNQDVRNISFSLELKDIENTSDLYVYNPGDIAEIYYHNPIDLTIRALNMVASIDPSTLITIERKSIFGRRPNRVESISNITAFDLFNKVLDIAAVPTRSFFEGLSHYATNLEERDKLIEISSAEGTDLYFDYCVKEKRNYIEIMEDFKSSRPPLEALISIIPIIIPRPYSIASSLSLDPKLLPKLDVCVAIVEYLTRYGRIKRGRCTDYLSSLSVDDKVAIRIKSGNVKKSSLILNESMKMKHIPEMQSISTTTLRESMKFVPLILIGPGTGVAPMRSIIQHYFMSKASSSIPSDGILINDSLFDILLFFGCRKSTKDNLYGTEWDGINNNMNPYDYNYAHNMINVIARDNNNSNKVKIITACSQDQENKVYVTHKIREHGEFVWSIIKQGGGIFIAGAASRMPKDVRKALIDVMLTYGEFSDKSDCEIFLQNMIRQGKYVVETWS